ncbi:hypothetical protein J0X19_23370 [Hymenobacter sp. BT186]|uniref:AlgX/AlgJ SGNH hydrolase-like domain-containing protein n=1 Tax=Hymenobacter telluris TaxID=2816474 RepID=A0A939F2J1_9BACT|nr:hypothetical protein [Hymenobacter telluris]MBO0360920.1 hypothetical protein [Hymenobacter telluris]MBW3376949.1 hypothetical protein [Hymenobacter norwichensis]
MTLLSNILKRLFLAVLLVVLLLPAVQTRFPIFKMGTLGGYSEQAPHPDFSWSGIFDNSYQPALEKYVEDRIGFREVLIRLRNQLAYSVFGVAKANAVLVGKNEVLLDEVAIRSYLGQDFKGDTVIQTNVRRFKSVQDTLARRGIFLAYVVAPDKANFYPEYYPSYFHTLPRAESNYTAYVRQMKNTGVNVLDLAQAFRQWKDTASYPLFPRGGIHWSGYGVTLAADSLFRYIEQHTHLDLPDFAATSRVITTEPRDTDNDIAKSLNLLKEPAAFEMAYPTVEFSPPKPNQQKPNVLIVGDSYVYSLIGFYPYIQNLLSDKTQFWYYNHQVQLGARDDMSPNKDVFQLNRKAEILNQKIVLVLFAQHSLGNFDRGFSADAFKSFNPYTAIDEKRVQAIEDKLRKSPAIQDSLWKQAHNTGQDYNYLFYNMAAAQYDLTRY